MNPSFASRGFSLVELIVSVALTSILLVGVATIFSSSRASYAATDRLSQVQESGRLALREITRDIRSAGFGGCTRTARDATTTLNHRDDIRWDFLDAPVRGYQGTVAGIWRPTLDASVIPGAASGNDVLILRGPVRNATPARLLASMQEDVDGLRIANPHSLQAGDIAFAYSCEAQSFFQVTAVEDGEVQHAVEPATDEFPGNAIESLGYAFRENTEIVPVQTVIYYIGANPAEAGSTSLWRRVGSRQPQQLVEGVDRMELQFGLDTTGDHVADHYVTADVVRDWKAVLSVSIALLVRSHDEARSENEARTYQLLDVTASAANDRRTREVFTALVGIRNRPADRRG